MANNIIAFFKERVFSKESRLYLMGIAILWIFFFHFYCWFNGTKPWWLLFFSEGQTGVDIFLFLSAYGLEASIHKNNWKKFYINRMKRIFPVYFLFLFTFYIIQNHVPFRKILIQCIGQLTGFSLFQTPLFFSCQFEFDWFTPALILLYISYPFISCGLNYLTKGSMWCEIFILVLLCIIGVIGFSVVYIPVKFLLYRLPIFMLGTVTYIHLKNLKVNRLFILYAIFFICGFLSNNDCFLESASIPIFITVYAFIQGARPFRRFISMLGRYSYEIYLAHIFPVTYFLKLVLIDNIFVYIIVTIVWTIFITTLYVYLGRIIKRLIFGNK